MSNWVTFRDELLKNLNFEVVTEEMKDAFSNWILTNLLPSLKSPAEKFVSQVTEQAKNEHGWVKIRDLIILPFIVRFGLWAIEKSLAKSQEKQ